MGMERAITKRKFNRIIQKIKKSIELKEDYLPSELCNELRDLGLWSDWCFFVKRAPRTLKFEKRRESLPKFIQEVKVIG